MHLIFEVLAFTKDLKDAARHDAAALLPKVSPSALVQAAEGKCGDST